MVEYGHYRELGNIIIGHTQWRKVTTATKTYHVYRVTYNNYATMFYEHQTSSANDLQYLYNVKVIIC